MKNIVICCDGTSNAPHTGRTNVMKLWLMLERDPSQVVYYDPGVGVLDSPSRLTRVGRWINRTADLAAGSGLGQNVIEAYLYLARVWAPGDRVYLFGFSRGAYTVRALAGMLRFVGLADPDVPNFVPYLWHVYSNTGGVPARFKRRIRTASQLKTFNRKPRVTLLGVWDTVSSWGWYFDFKTLPNTAKCPNVDHIRHAVAINERRAAFAENLFDPGKNRDLQEVWFAGTHCDVGGGHPEPESGLSKIPLVWMIDEAVSLGLRVDPVMRNKLLGGANRKGRTQYSAPDALAPLHRSMRGLWPLLEFLPHRVWIGSVGERVWRLHCFRRRKFRAEGSAVHLSVGARRRGLGYSAPDIATRL
ncbi:MAG: DUF2235 domain-containing protein [Phycisphaeraceae bacterium]|nr:DUF2235 domain-containing protein [Phycisphaeraceae bacterium]